MKKLSLFIFAIVISFALQAQWVDDPTTNTFIANCDSGSGEIRVATSPDGGTFVQWTSMSSNGWSPKLQYLNPKGVPQWGEEGIHITTDNIATWSPGYAMAALSDGSVVSMFRTADARHWVVKVNPDGSTPWGTDGMVLFNGEGGGRSELLAGDDGGFWALGTDMDNSFLCYVNADGTLEPTITISDPAKKCSNGVLIPSEDGIFVVYSKHTLQGYTNYNKEIYVAKYNKEGEQILPETLLFGLQTVGAGYIHHAIPDGLGGCYVFQWHNSIGGVYNTYVTHFNASGTPTISDTNGVTVHSPDPSNFYINAYPTIDPVSHDLLLVYRQTDSYSQSQYKIYINRITATGEKPWGDGILVLDNGTTQCGGLRIDAFEYGEGFSVIYHKAVSGAYQETIEAHGFDMEGNVIWNTQMCLSTYPKTGDENTTGFHNGQNITTWVNSQDGGLYGQNIGWDGTMGDVTPPTPIIPCDPPTDFQGTYYFETNTDFGVHLTWMAPQELPLHYNLYFTDPSGCTTTIEVAPTETEYLDQMSIVGAVTYQLTAVYEDCESEFALTPEGEDHVTIEITGIHENMEEEIVSILGIYNIHGQLVNTKNTHDLRDGVYFIKGTTETGRIIIKKVLR